MTDSFLLLPISFKVISNKKLIIATIGFPKMNIYTRIISSKLNIKEQSTENTLLLLEEGCTIPFIARYRKERTGGLDEVQIGQISEWNDRLQEISKRKETILKTIAEQDKLTDELKKRIDSCWDSTELEDIYLPFKPKRRTKAQIAREQGLEPLATIIMLQRERNIHAVAGRFINDNVPDEEAALEGAKHIIAETISENEQTRQRLRNTFLREAVISSTNRHASGYVTRSCARRSFRPRSSRQRRMKRKPPSSATTSISRNRCVDAPATVSLPCAVVKTKDSCE